MTYNNNQCNYGVLNIQKVIILDKIIEINDGDNCKYHEKCSHLICPVIVSYNEHHVSLWLLLCVNIYTVSHLYACDEELKVRLTHSKIDKQLSSMMPSTSTLDRVAVCRGNVQIAI